MVRFFLFEHTRFNLFTIKFPLPKPLSFQMEFRNLAYASSYMHSAGHNLSPLYVSVPTLFQLFYLLSLALAILLH